jgi:ABC-2 type transport system permease protein
MNTPVANLHEVEPPAGAPLFHATRPFYWCLRRELWEYRSIYMGPLAVAAVFLFGFLISTIRLAPKLPGLDAKKTQELLQAPYDLAALLIMGTTFLIAIFYSLEAFQSERRDRSILFWKSLPVSDLLTVLAKATVPIIILPLVTLVVTLLTQWLMLLVGSAVLASTGVGLATLWDNVPVGGMQLGLVYHLIAIHSLWYAPIFGYLLLVSAWARRFAFLWAALPLLAVGFVEKIAFNSTHFGDLLAGRIAGATDGRSAASASMAMSHVHPGDLLASPGLWIGLVLTVVFLTAAARIRRYRGPI